MLKCIEGQGFDDILLECSVCVCVCKCEIARKGSRNVGHSKKCQVCSVVTIISVGCIF